MSELTRDEKLARRRRRMKRVRLVVRYVVLTVVGFTMVLPFLWMLSTSLKTKEGAVEIPPQWIPRRQTTSAEIDGRRVTVSVLKRTAEVRRLDTGEVVTVYREAVRETGSWWNPLGEKRTVANIPRPAGGFDKDVPVHVLSTTARVRILEEGPRLHQVVDLPGDDVHTDSWVSLEYGNYPEAWNKLPFDRAYVNTIIISVTITFGQVFTCSLAAFAFARLRFPGRDKLFLGYLATMMIPGAVTLIPVYVLFMKMPEWLNDACMWTNSVISSTWLLDWWPWRFIEKWFERDLYFLGRYYVGRLVGGNSYFALIAPGLFSAYGTFMLRQFFMGLPKELEDAARIDGCGNLRIYWHVTLPLSKVALATLATFTFMGTWKAFMWPLIICNREEMLPLQVLLQRFNGQYGAEYTLLMAGSIIVLAPLLVVFLLGQRYFVKGIQLGGVKG